MQIVTSNGDVGPGTNSAARVDLATTADIAGIKGQIGGLQPADRAVCRRDRELADGIAVSLALFPAGACLGKTVGSMSDWATLRAATASA